MKTREIKPSFRKEAIAELNTDTARSINSGLYFPTTVLTNLANFIRNTGITQ